MPLWRWTRCCRLEAIYQNVYFSRGQPLKSKVRNCLINEMTQDLRTGSRVLLMVTAKMCIKRNLAKNAAVHHLVLFIQRRI